MEECRRSVELSFISKLPERYILKKTRPIGTVLFNGEEWLNKGDPFANEEEKNRKDQSNVTSTSEQWRESTHRGECFSSNMESSLWSYRIELIDSLYLLQYLEERTRDILWKKQSKSRTRVIRLILIKLLHLSLIILYRCGRGALYEVFVRGSIVAFHSVHFTIRSIIFVVTLISQCIHCSSSMLCGFRKQRFWRVLIGKRRWRLEEDGVESSIRMMVAAYEIFDDTQVSDLCQQLFRVEQWIGIQFCITLRIFRLNT